ncbi:MAG: PAS domain-containing protein [Salinivirgaceae bacterium]|nr:PAS domain-containing protein [Salinivirgaceae bacterium]
MNKDTKLDKEQLQLFLNFIQDAPTPIGIIKYSFFNNENHFSIIHISKSTIDILKIETPENKNASHFFKNIKNIHSNFFIELIKNPSKDQQTIIQPLNGNFLKLNFKKLDAFHISFSIEDITQLHQQRIELATKKRQLKESHEIANLGYWVESHKKQKHIWSDNVYKILDADKETVSPSFKNYLSFVHPEDVKNVQTRFEKAIKNKTGYDLNHRLLLKNGQIKYMTLRCYTDYDGKGNSLQSVGIIQDISNYEQTKHQLQKSETIFRSVFEDAPIAIVLVNSDLKPVFSNNQFSDITGYSIKEIIQKTVKDFTHPDDYNQNEKQYNKLFNNEINTFSITKRYLKKDGSKIWVKATVSAIRGLTEEGDYAIAMVQDISSEKIATEALMRSEYKYRTLIENANDGIGLFDADFNPIIYNTALYKMLGYTLDEYLSIDHKKFELFHPDDIKCAQKALLNLKNGERSKIESRLLTKSGIYKYCAISYIPVWHDDQPAILIFRRDISKRKSAELQNEEYRMFLETIMDNLPVSFFAKTTPDFRYLYWNKTIEHYTGIPAEEAIGKTDFELMQFKSLAEKYHDEDTRILKNKRKIESEYEFTNYDGGLKQFKTIKALHNSSTGNPIILGLSLDITELKKAQDQIEQSTQMLKEAQKIAKLGYWEYDVAKDLFFDNLENRQILGIDNLPYFINVKQFVDLVLPADQDAVEKSLKKCIKNSTPGNGIVRIATNNTIKHISINYKPISDENGKVIKLRGTCLDISRIRNSEISIKESETRLKQAEHIAKIGYWNFDFESNKTQFSDEIWNIVEMTPNSNKFNFSDFLNLVHQDDKIHVDKVFNNSKNNNKPFNIEFKILTISNKLKHIKAIGTFVKNQQNQTTKAIGTFQDITESKKFETHILSKNNQLKEIQKIAKISFIDYQIGSNEILFSENIKDLLGIKETKQLKNLDDFSSFIHKEDKKTIELTHKKYCETQESYSIQYRLISKLGELKNISEICNFYEDACNKKVHVLRIIQDITDIKEKDRTINKFYKENKSLLSKRLIYDINKNTLLPNSESQKKYDLANSLNLDQFLEYIHPSDKFSIKKAINKSIQLKEDILLSFRLIHGKANAISFIRLNGVYNQKTNIYNFSIKDLTEMKTLMNEVQSSNELFKSISDNSIFATLIFKNGYHTYVNEKWRQLTGIKSDAKIEKLKLQDIYKPDSAVLLTTLFQKWKDYQLTEYTNELTLKPVHAPEFKAEIFVKEIIVQNEPSFLILAYPIKS